MGIKYSVNEDFFKRWSNDSAYVLGFIFADGSLENAPYIRGKYLRVTNTDYSVIKQIRRAIGSAHKFAITPATGNRKKKYLLRIGSHVIFNDLERLGVHPKKSNNMNFPNVPSKFLSDFVRGYFDGDGTIAVENIKNKPHNRLKVIFTSGSKEFLLSLANALNKWCCVKLVKIYNSHRSYQLSYRSKDALNALRFIYKTANKEGALYMDRKYNKFKQLISDPDSVRCGNLFDKSSKIWNYNIRRRTQVV